jgi:hypothetical protein
MADMKTRIEEFCKSDRGWPRHLRIAHAEYQARLATTEDGRNFWRGVKNANGTDFKPQESRHDIR